MHDATGTRWPRLSHSRRRGQHTESRWAFVYRPRPRAHTHTNARTHTFKYKSEHDCMHRECIHKEYMQSGTCIYELISMNIQIPRHPARVFLQVENAYRLTQQAIRMHTHKQAYTHTDRIIRISKQQTHIHTNR